MADIFQIIENNGTPKNIGDSKARANIAPTFNVSNANEVGDLVLSDTGILYRFNAAYTAGTSWNSRTSKEQVNIANELQRFTSHTLLSEGTDLNTINKSGIYCCPNMNVAATLINCPATYGFEMSAFYWNNNTCSQLIISSECCWFRRANNEAWFTITRGDALGIIENKDIAVNNISPNEYVMWKGNFYSARTNITPGLTLSSSNLANLGRGALNSLNYRIENLQSSIDNKKDVKNTQLTNEDLNKIAPEYTRWYYAAGGNQVLNKPSGIDSFGMVCFRSASGYIIQIIFDTFNTTIYSRYGRIDLSSFGAWAKWNVF